MRNELVVPKKKTSIWALYNCRNVKLWYTLIFISLVECYDITSDMRWQLRHNCPLWHQVQIKRSWNVNKVVDVAGSLSSWRPPFLVSAYHNYCSSCLMPLLLVLVYCRYTIPLFLPLCASSWTSAWTVGAYRLHQVNSASSWTSTLIHLAATISGYLVWCHCCLS